MTDVVVNKGSSFERRRLSTAKRLDFDRRGSLSEGGWGADGLGGSGELFVSIIHLNYFYYCPHHEYFQHYLQFKLLNKTVQRM